MFHLTIVTAEKTIYEGEIEMLIATAVNGELGILQNHQPIVTKLDPGPLRFVKADKNEDRLFIGGGYLEFSENKAIILADVAEDLDAIQLEEARAARMRAQEMLKLAKDEVEAQKLEEELRAHLMRERLAEVSKFSKKGRV